MAVNIALLLDKAKTVHRLSSDYKLALVMGVSASSLANYRTGKTFPDARVISILCHLTGDDPEQIAADVEEMRATTPEARALWRSISVLIANSRRAGVGGVNYRKSGKVLPLVGAHLPVMRPSHSPNMRPAPPRAGFPCRSSAALALVA